jgi:methylmalonyl-CoA epimerase
LTAAGPDGRGAGPMRLDHVSIAVPDLDAALVLWTGGFGFRLAHRETVAPQGVEVALLEAGAARVELVTGPGVASFLARRGPGLHHVAFAVPSLAEALAGVGIDPVEPAMRPGAQGRTAAYLHPRETGGVLVELIEQGGGTGGESEGGRGGGAGGGSHR